MITFRDEVDLRQFLEKPLIGLLTGAAAIRFAGIFSRGIQYDDAFSILLAGRSLREIIQGTAADTMPPLYYLILHFWQFIGRSIAFQRLPGILFSLGIIFVAYKIVNQVENERAGIWTAAILAVSPLQYYHAQDIRMYSLATFLVLVWNWGALQLFYAENPRKIPVWTWLLIICSGTAALYSHALAGFGLLVPFVFLLLKRKWHRFLLLVGAGLLAGLLYLPWLGFVPGQIAKVQRAFWTPQPGIVEILQSIIMVLGDIPLPSFALGVVLFSSISVAVFCLIIAARHRENLRNFQFFVLMAFIPPFILFGLSYLMRPVFVPRAFLSAYVGVSACIGIAAARARLAEKYGIGSFILLAAVITLPFQVSFDEFPRSPFRQTSEYLRAQISTGDVVLHDNKLSYFPFEVYLPDLPNRFLADAPGTANDTLDRKTQSALGFAPEENMGGVILKSKKIYFVVFEQTMQEYEQKEVPHPVIQELNTSAGLLNTHRFGDLLVLEYSTLAGEP